MKHWYSPCPRSCFLRGGRLALQVKHRDWSFIASPIIWCAVLKKLADVRVVHSQLVSDQDTAIQAVHKASFPMRPSGRSATPWQANLWELACCVRPLTCVWQAYFVIQFNATRMNYLQSFPVRKDSVNYKLLA
jgi:hypothetical protein